MWSPPTRPYAGAVEAEYALGTLPRALRVRLALVSTAGGLLVLLLAAVGTALAMRLRPGGSLAATVLVVAAALAAVAIVGRQTLTPHERHLVRESRRRVLGPLDAAGRSPELRVALRPGPINRRRLRQAPPELVCLTADAQGLRVPGWLLEGRPRGLGPTDSVLLPWHAVRRWRVRADSEGPDLWVVDCVRVPGAPARWRVRRPEITDEVAVLDFARAFGQVTVELETSVG
ncbi:hypothetical protein CCE01nite_09080 [Cellulomonas cellasea]|uniref:Uncharacterized protein n=1 Tax=Cellulomonas cellasea TaxID=43670 RepID=A0A4Y3KRC0_9CELL|nr:hypothetical protein CCE01nite_09080 [Cellulomonas cellasea]